MVLVERDAELATLWRQFAAVISSGTAGSPVLTTSSGRSREPAEPR